MTSLKPSATALSEYRPAGIFAVNPPSVAVRVSLTSRVAPSRINWIKAPVSGVPLLSRTVPVIVAKPRGPLPYTDALNVATIMATIASGILKLKSFFIAVGPPAFLRGFAIRSKTKPVGRSMFVRFFVWFARCLSVKFVINPKPWARRPSPA